MITNTKSQTLVVANIKGLILCVCEYWRANFDCYGVYGLFCRYDEFKGTTALYLASCFGRLPAQRKWLEGLAKQLVHEVIIDREFVNSRLADHGGAKQLDKG